MRLISTFFFGLGMLSSGVSFSQTNDDNNFERSEFRILREMDRRLHRDVPTWSAFREMTDQQQIDFLFSGIDALLIHLDELDEEHENYEDGIEQIFRSIRRVEVNFDSLLPSWFDFHNMSSQSRVEVIENAFQELVDRVKSRQDDLDVYDSELAGLRRDLARARAEIFNIESENRILEFQLESGEEVRSIEFRNFLMRFRENENVIELLSDIYSFGISIDIVFSTSSINCLQENIERVRTDSAVPILLAYCISASLSEQGESAYVDRLEHQLQLTRQTNELSQHATESLQRRLDLANNLITQLQQQVERQAEQLDYILIQAENIEGIDLSEMPTVEED